jgi:hypothetical protein
MRKEKKTVLVGEKYNRLYVKEFSHSDKRARKWFHVKCDCGNVKIVMGAAMVSGNTKSCGCYGKESARSKRISDNHSEVTAIMLGYKRHAEVRGFKWLLSREDVLGVIKMPCNYCGVQPSNVKRTKNSIGDGLSYSGIDRVDSSKDYTVDNIVPCCKICNYAKSNMPLAKFREWAIKIGSMALQWGGDITKSI